MFFFSFFLRAFDSKRSHVSGDSTTTQHSADPPPSNTNITPSHPGTKNLSSQILPDTSTAGGAFPIGNTSTQFTACPQPNFIEPSRPKTLVWACDGTGQKGTANDGVAKSNVFKLCQMLKGASRVDDPSHKVVVIYHDGPAADMQSSSKADKMKNIEKAMLGSDVDDRIMAGYYALCENYNTDDEIVLIGFSRGAFVARCIQSIMCFAGGLLEFDSEESSQCRADQVKSLYKLWEEAAGNPCVFPLEKRRKFKIRLRSGKVKHLVLFDTVASVRKTTVFGFHQQLTFVDSTLASNVDYVSHAMALHDHRELFFPIPITECDNPNTRAVNMWFAGIHKDVGGGNGREGFERFPLAWMMGQIRTINGIDLNRVTTTYAGQQQNPDTMDWSYAETKKLADSNILGEWRIPACQQWSCGKAIHIVWPEKAPYKMSSVGSATDMAIGDVFKSYDSEGSRERTMEVPERHKSGGKAAHVKELIQVLEDIVCDESPIHG
ncbi:hypothetical protein J7T55_011506 [Diaporthe amygdali]|uniref:uncharacterized protein n=1 Tax=Phomopsis amygdali TaxID=1214568 RepID=UPI0022FE09B5|nr:uncharacterized protein J7T55_011506 [Diaporthe amygdali]KAJ0123044.1 hypothetical protein J7T55_011506 [Diaporthe amygdali]